MTLAKRLLLGSAAALVATTGAQAADLGLPVAPAVDYVQICSIGSFTGWILPGSDVCFDISGFARFQADFGAANDSYLNLSDDIDFQSEAEVQFDARTMTEWGLLRSYISIGNDGQGEDYNAEILKAFVQIGGLTAGLTDSFFDPVYTDYAMAALGVPDGGTDDLTLIGYSFALGNGVTISASIEDNDGNGRFGGVAAVNAGGVPLTAAGAAITAFGQTTGNFQDTSNGLAGVVAVRVDQAWGSAKLAGAITQVDVDQTALVAAGLPVAWDDSELGWAIQASAALNLPVGVGSSFGVFGIYTDGAISYMGAGGAQITNLAGTTITDIGLDAVISSTGQLQTTTAWALGAGFEFGVSSMIDLEMDAYYADVDHGAAIGALGDYNVYGVRGSVAYTPVSGLELRAGVGYTSYDADNTVALGGLTASNYFGDGFTARFRITRSF